jgi:hypothetical protein
LGLYDIYKRLLGERSTADVTTGQDLRRRQVVETIRRRRNAEARAYLRTKKQKQIAATVLDVGQPLGKAGGSYDPISEIFGFKVAKKKARGRRR